MVGFVCFKILMGYCKTLYFVECKFLRICHLDQFRHLYLATFYIVELLSCKAVFKFWKLDHNWQSYGHLNLPMSPLTPLDLPPLSTHKNLVFYSTAPKFNVGEHNYWMGIWQILYFFFDTGNYFTIEKYLFILKKNHQIALFPLFTGPHTNICCPITYPPGEIWILWDFY